MAQQKKFKLTREQLRKLRQHPAIHDDLLKRAKKIAKACGGEKMGYKVTSLTLEDPRAAVSVMATGHAHQHNRKHNTLLKNLEAGRG